MKKLIAVIFFVITAIILTACGESEESPQAGQGTTPLETISAVTEPPRTAEIPAAASTIAPDKELISADDLETLTSLIYRISGAEPGAFPVFNDIHKVDLVLLMWFAQSQPNGGFSEAIDVYDCEEGERRHQRLFSFGEWEGSSLNIGEVDLVKFESFIKETLNSNFSLSNYDYKSIKSEGYMLHTFSWDEENQVMAYTVWVTCFGWNSYIIEITNSYELNGYYYAYATRYGSGFNSEEIFSEYLKYTFAKSENGSFNIISIKELADGEIGEWFFLADSLYDLIDMSVITNIAFDGDVVIVVSYDNPPPEDLRVLAVNIKTGSITELTGNLSHYNYFEVISPNEMYQPQVLQVYSLFKEHF
jgi:hypothetical protein